jgi:hypothetical protein
VSFDNYGQWYVCVSVATDHVPVYLHVSSVSPYLKALSQVTSSKLLHLTEAFCTPWFLFANPTNHHLVFFLLELFNNVIQYQFDGNAQLIYTIIRKRSIFHELANLPTDPQAVTKPRKAHHGDHGHPAREDTSASASQDTAAEERSPAAAAATATATVATVEVEQPVHAPTLTSETTRSTSTADTESVSQDKWVATKEWVSVSLDCYTICISCSTMECHDWYIFCGYGVW